LGYHQIGAAEKAASLYSVFLPWLAATGMNYPGGPVDWNGQLDPCTFTELAF
jgi:hypothetical protein